MVYYSYNMIVVYIAEWFDGTIVKGSDFGTGILLLFCLGLVWAAVYGWKTRMVLVYIYVVWCYKFCIIMCFGC